MILIIKIKIENLIHLILFLKFFKFNKIIDMDNFNIKIHFNAFQF